MPYSNWHALSGPPLGLMLAFKVAVLDPTSRRLAFPARRGDLDRLERDVGAFESAGGALREDSEVVFGVWGESGELADTATGLFRTRAAICMACLLRGWCWCRMRTGIR